MTHTALDIARNAVAKWRQYHGNESLYNQCQRYDGYYWQWAWAGTEAGIRVYASAKDAAAASAMFTKNLNDSSISPGDLVYWHFSKYGHVGTVIGRDGNRTMVTQTGSVGDSILDLGNHVKVSHADTLPLTVQGVSHTNGANRRRTGMEPYNRGNPSFAGTGGTVTTISETEDEMKIVNILNEGLYFCGPAFGMVHIRNVPDAHLLTRLINAPAASETKRETFNAAERDRLNAYLKGWTP